MLEGANATHEMSKFFHAPQAQHWKAVRQFVGFLKAERNNI